MQVYAAFYSFLLLVLISVLSGQDDSLVSFLLQIGTMTMLFHIWKELRYKNVEDAVEKMNDDEISLH